MKQLLTWLRWPIALGIVAWMFSQHADGFDRMSARPLIWSWVLLAMAARGFAVVLSCVRWRMLVRAQDIPFPMRDALRLGLLGNLFNFIVPGTVGGDLTKAVMVARENPQARAIVTATVVLDRILGLLSLMLLASLASLGHFEFWQQPQLATAMTALIGGSVIGLTGLAVMLHPAALRLRVVAWLSGLPRLGSLVGTLCRGIALYQKRRGVLVRAIGISLLSHSANVSSYFCCAVALGLTGEAPGWLAHMVIVPVAELAASVLPLPGGVGAREGALQYLYAASIGHGTALSEAGFYTAVSFSLSSLVVAALAGLVATGLKRSPEKQSAPPVVSPARSAPVSETAGASA